MAKAIMRVVSPTGSGRSIARLRRAIIEQALSPAPSFPKTRLESGSARAGLPSAMRSDNWRPRGWPASFRRNKGAAVATPSWGSGAGHFRMFALRWSGSSCSGSRATWTRAQTEQLKAHVAEEEKARDATSRCRSGSQPNSTSCSRR